MDHFSIRNAWCSNTSPTRICAETQLLNLLQQQFHFRLRADGDAHETRAEILGALAQQNPLALEPLKQSRPSSPEICQQKISRACKSLDAHIIHLFFNPHTPPIDYTPTTP